MKNALKLIIEAIKVAMEKTIDKISWNTLKDKPFYEEVNKNIIVPEQTLENFEAMEDPIYVAVNRFTMTPIVGDTYTVNWDGNSYDVVAKDLDGLVYIGNENYVDMSSGGDIPFAIVFADANIFVTIESTETSYTEETHTISIFTTQTTIHKIDKKYIPEIGIKSWNDLEDRPFGEELEKCTQAELIDDTWSDRATCKLFSTPIEWAENNSYKIRVDGVVYEFDGMSVFKATSSTSMQNVYYIGATYLSLNKNMDFSEYSFCFLTTDFVNIYAVFEDATLNHTVEFLESEAKINYLDSKFIKDMYYEEEGYIAALSYTPNISTLSDDILSYGCTMDEIAAFRELLDNNSEITVGIGETLYTLEFKGISSGYYRLYYNDSMVFEYYMGNTNKQINFYYKNLGLSSAPEGDEVTFYKPSTLIHKIDEKYLPDSLISTPEDALALSIEMGLIEPVGNNGYVFTDENGVIYTI